MKSIFILITGAVTTILATSCNPADSTVQIGENTFVHNKTVYRIIDNEITELGSLASDSISKSMVLHPTLKNYNDHSLDYVSTGAYTQLTAVYRGDVLYFNLHLNGLNNLREKYRGGSLTINFVDEYGFQMNSTSISIGEFTRILGQQNETVRFEYNGKLQMSSELYKSIFTYEVSSSLVEKGKYGW